MSAESSERPSAAAACFGPSGPSEAPVRVATAGEALMDLIGQPDGRLQPCAGGSVYNLSRALALQGVGTRYLNPLSGDRWGRLLARGLLDAGAQLAHPQAVEAPTSLAVVGLDEQGKAHYSFYRDGVADRQTTATDLIAACNAMPSLQVVATGCLALVPQDQPVYGPWLVQQRQAGRWVAVDANLRPALCPDAAAYRQAVMQALQQAHLIKASDDDLRLLGWTDADPLDAARELLNQTPAQAIALTLGAQGAVLLQRDGPSAHACETRPLPLADTVGAGDTFLAGLLAAWLATTPNRPPQPLDAEALAQVLSRAVVSATLCVARVGCVPPTAAEVAHRTTQAPPRCTFL